MAAAALQSREEHTALEKRRTLTISLILLSLPSAGQELRWSELPSAADAPAPRYDGAIAYDSPGKLVFLFGGSTNEGSQNDLWAYSLDDQRWRKLDAPPAPPARFGHTLAFDSLRRRLILFGGQAFGFFSDTWAFDIVARRWQNLSGNDAGPNRRYGHSAVYDARRDRLIISHGFTDDGRFDDTWTFDLKTNRWQNLNPGGTKPIKRCLHHAEIDTQGDQMLLYGGCASGVPGGNCPLDDLWLLDLERNQWQRKTSQPMPLGRQWYGMAFDQARRRMTIFGGSGGPGNDVWEYDPAANAWRQLQPAGEKPAPRSRHMGTYVSDLKGAVFFGGRIGGSLSNTLLVLGASQGGPPPAPQLAPRISDSGVRDAFSGEAGAVAPGEIVSLFGTDLGPPSGVAAQYESGSGKLPNSLAGTVARVDGLPAPLYFVRTDQINLQVPYEVAGKAEVEIVIQRGDQVSGPVRVPVKPARPGLFPVAFHANGSEVSETSPAAAGETILLFATGQGLTNPPSVTGAPAAAPYPEPEAEVRLLIAGREARLSFRGLAPETVGVMQLNADVPAGISGTTAAVVLEIGGSRSQSGVTIPVRPE